MGPAQAIATGFARSLQFSGRASRPEFWWPALGAVAVLLLALALARLANANDPVLAMMLAFLLGVLPLPAAGARRLRDAANRLGWLFAGLLVLLWLAALPSLGVYLNGRLTQSLFGPEFRAALFFVFVLLPATALLPLLFILPLTRVSAAEQSPTVPTA